MSHDLKSFFSSPTEQADRAVNERAKGLRGSIILDIASEVKTLQARGVPVQNFTIGDFSPSQFRIPKAFEEQIAKAYAEGQTNYPPAVGTPELRSAIRSLYKRKLGLDYPEGCVQVGSGARPPIYSAFATILEPGDTLVYPVPSWNNNHYAHLNGAHPVAITTHAEDGFMPTVEALMPVIREARVICINSPLNPSGTLIRRELLGGICEAILTENRRRDAVAERPLFLLYDQVYWQLTFGDAEHLTPVGLFPEMAKYTIFIDAISKCWASTGLRVGWAVVPPWIRDKMKPLIGHMGAWAPRPEQMATAALLDNPALFNDELVLFHQQLQARLDRLHAGFQALKSDGFAVDSLAPEGAIYLTVKFDLIGQVVNGEPLNEEGVRSLLLHKAHVAIVPFSAFGYPKESGWVRFSIGAVSLKQIDRALKNIRELLMTIGESSQ